MKWFRAFYESRNFVSNHPGKLCATNETFPLLQVIYSIEITFIRYYTRCTSRSNDVNNSYWHRADTWSIWIFFNWLFQPTAGLSKAYCGLRLWLWGAAANIVVKETSIFSFFLRREEYFYNRDILSFGLHRMSAYSLTLSGQLPICSDQCKNTTIRTKFSKQLTGHIENSIFTFPHDQCGWLSIVEI